MKPLYQTHDEVGDAYLIEEGTLYFQFPIAVLRGFEVEEVLVGTVERFLPVEHKHRSTRLFGLSVDDDARFREVSLRELSRRMQDYAYGFQTNTFLAIALKMGNEAFLEVQDGLPSSMKSYQVRARIFARIVNNLAAIANRLQKEEMLEVAALHFKTGLYKDGALLIRENRLANPQLPSTAMKKYIQKFESGEVICKEGEKATAMFALLKGRIGVVTGGKHIAEIDLPGEAFGEASLFLEGERTATLIAREKTAVYKIKQDDLPDFHRTHPDMFLAIARTLALRIADTVEKIEEVALTSRKAKFGEEADSWESKDRLAEGQLDRLYSDIDRLQSKLKLPELQELWGKFISTQ